MVFSTDRRREDANRGAAPVVLIVVLAIAAIGVAAALFLNSRWNRREAQRPVLTEEARAYVRGGYLELSEVEMKAKENFAQQTLVEVTGKITNKGTRTVQLVEVNCVFHDPYGMVVLRERLSIVGGRAGGLKPGETKTFRLPFDTLPQSWNQALPDLVIAQILFG
jgi:Tfp pilus assembly protein PilX